MEATSAVVFLLCISVLCALRLVENIICYLLLFLFKQQPFLSAWIYVHIYCKFVDLHIDFI